MKPKSELLFDFYSSQDSESLNQRFGFNINQDQLRAYVDRVVDESSILFNFIFDVNKEDFNLIGVYEIHNIDDISCEIAVMVDKKFRGMGYGKALFTSACIEALNLYYEKVLVVVTQNNLPMKKIISSVADNLISRIHPDDTFVIILTEGVYNMVEKFTKKQALDILEHTKELSEELKKKVVEALRREESDEDDWLPSEEEWESSSNCW